jgi:hypothetical protein
MSFRVALVSISLLLSGAAAASEATGDSYRTRLVTAAFQSPAGPFEGDGKVVASLSGRTLKLTGYFERLSSPVTRLRLLSGAAVGVPDGIDIAIIRAATGAPSGRIKTALTLTPAQVELLSAGRLYVQVETKAAPEGALWGWLLPNHPFPGENVPEERNWYAK